MSQIYTTNKVPRPNLFQSFIFLFIGGFFLQCFSACKSDRLNVDVSSIKVDLEFDRLDEKLRDTPPEKMPQKHIEFANEYGKLYQTFVEVMLKEGPVYDEQTALGMQRFLENKDIQSVYTEIHNSFPEETFKKQEFEQVFKYYAYYFPKDTLPEIVGYYSNFNAKSLLFNNTIAVGLDMYLGKENIIIKRIPVSSLPQYFKDKMSPEYLVSDALKIYLLNKHYRDIGEDFLSTIVSLGKIMYLLDACSPTTENWKKMSYSEEELKWCKENEEQIWAYIVNEELLFSVEQDRINNFIGEGPNTKGLPQNSPSRVGIWIGWQMVKDYMDENPKISIQEMLNETDSKKILKYYKP